MLVDNYARRVKSGRYGPWNAIKLPLASLSTGSAGEVALVAGRDRVGGSVSSCFGEEERLTLDFQQWGRCE